MTRSNSCAGFLVQRPTRSFRFSMSSAWSIRVPDAVSRKCRTFLYPQSLHESVSCRFPSGFSLQDQNELCWCQYLDALVFLQVREMLRIATYQVISFFFHRSLDKHIIVGVSL